MTATANSGCIFSNWTENGNEVSTSASYSFTVTGNRTLVANFVYYDGIGEQENFEVSLYPIPVHDKLIVEIVEPANLLEIFSIVGTLVYSQADLPCKMVIQMDGLVNGTYLVRFTKGTSVVTRIFVKQ